MFLRHASSSRRAPSLHVTWHHASSCRVPLLRALLLRTALGKTVIRMACAKPINVANGISRARANSLSVMCSSGVFAQIERLLLPQKVYRKTENQRETLERETLANEQFVILNGVKDLVRLGVNRTQTHEILHSVQDDKLLIPNTFTIPIHLLRTEFYFTVSHSGNARCF